MYAVIKTGGKQYRVAADDVLTVEKIVGDAGTTLEFGEVLMVGGNGAGPTIGTPLVSGALDKAEVVEQGRGPKVIAFKKRRRKNSRRKRGHRQELTTVKITEIIGA
jgi:large subunit ribosomal protein L21